MISSFLKRMLTGQHSFPKKTRIFFCFVLFILAFILASLFLDRLRMTGTASWYGKPFHGRKTASGEIYDQEAMTAAHRYFQFGTLVSVTNLENRKEVIVRINDRGPYWPGRIIDLSKGSAESLGMLKKGLARVRLRIIKP